ncbi:sensor histidine kinase, partial [Peterkaempfera griseoplana]|uniref:sensor histidine kinase n=1 Tax=Peterkaempfera griseoplana TaxID=66896 RepID=UPI0006E3F01B
VRLLRRRSVAASLFAVAVVAAAAMTAGTVMVAQAMFLSDHDLGVVMAVVGMSALAAQVPAQLIGRRVVAGSRALVAATDGLGSDEGFTAPAGLPTSELTALGRALEDTSARLAASRRRERALEASRRELIAWISHDLRTPLAGLRAMAESLEDGVAEDPARYHRRIRAEVDRLSGMVDDLFELSRIHAGALTLSLTRVCAYDLVDEALSGAQPLAREHGVRLVDGGVAAEPVEVDGREMSRVLANLLVNAIRATPADGTVAVAARREGDAVVLSVQDGCGGIPAQDLPRVFDTGWRGGAARSPRHVSGDSREHHGDTGAGLGLAIVRGIVEAHAGRAEVRNVGGGCCFEVILPAPGHRLQPPVGAARV